MTVPVPNVGDFAQASWADLVAADINASLNYGQGSLGSDASSNSVTLATTSDTLGVNKVTFTLAAQRRVKVTSMAIFTMASGTVGRYKVHSAYIVGSTAVLAGSTGFGTTGAVAVTTTTGGNGAPSATHIGDALIPAGTYTAFLVVTRLAGGSATDTSTNGYILVEDIDSN